MNLKRRMYLKRGSSNHKMSEQQKDRCRRMREARVDLDISQAEMMESMSERVNKSTYGKVEREEIPLRDELLNHICNKYPSVNKTFIELGEGSPLNINTNKNVKSVIKTNDVNNTLSVSETGVINKNQSIEELWQSYEGLRSIQSTDSFTLAARIVALENVISKLM
jgi:transcriptional regulator with XRE-family HTH domain